MKKMKDVIAGVLHISAGKINDKTSPENVKKWDSLRGLLLITELENNYRIKFTMKDILSIKNVGDIKKILKKHNIDADE